MFSNCTTNMSCTMNRNMVESVNAKLILVSVVGLGLSVYAFIVENKLEVDNHYEPMCDIHEHMSCSKAFSSEYGKGFGLIPSNSVFYKPNSFYGIVAYCIFIALSMINNKTGTTVSLYLAVLANFSSVYFAYILYFILHDLCIVCVSIYITNAVLLKYVLSKYKLVNSAKNKTQ